MRGLYAQCLRGMSRGLDCVVVMEGKRGELYPANPGIALGAVQKGFEQVGAQTDGADALTTPRPPFVG